MPVFTCNHCGDSLQKPKVEKHYQFHCRNVKFLTCVDCHKDFKGEEYVPHTKCITEDERYGAKGTAKNNFVKKGEVKQENWIDMIQSIIATETNIKPKHKKLLSSLLQYNNIPRKKNKFFNFMKTTCGNKVADQDVDAIWIIIEKHKNAQVSSRVNSKDNDKKTENGQSEETVNCKSNDDENEREVGDGGVTNSDELCNKTKKKRKLLPETENSLDEKTNENENGVEIISSNEILSKKKKKFDNDVNSNGVHNISGKKLKLSEVEDDQNANKTMNEVNSNNSVTHTVNKFDYEAKILEILKKKTSISLKKLEKKITKSYLHEKGESEDVQKVVKKLNKKIKKLDGVTIENNIVRLN